MDPYIKLCLDTSHGLLTKTMKKKQMKGFHTNGACPFFRNLCPIMVQMIHILFFAVLGSRSRTAQAGMAISHLDDDDDSGLDDDVSNLYKS